jgi:phosphoglycerate dehydrogenase-like enzyme
VTDAMIDALAGVEFCVIQMSPLTEKVLAASHDLRLFCVSRGGPVNTNLAAATEYVVAITFAPGRNATVTAEHTLAMIGSPVAPTLNGCGAEVLFGAAFDVFPEEPIPAGSRLQSTPHVAGASKETAAKAAQIVAGDVGRYLRGEPLTHCANPTALRTSTA